MKINNTVKSVLLSSALLLNSWCSESKTSNVDETVNYSRLTINELIRLKDKKWCHTSVYSWNESNWNIISSVDPKYNRDCYNITNSISEKYDYNNKQDNLERISRELSEWQAWLDEQNSRAEAEQIRIDAEDRAYSNSMIYKDETANLNKKKKQTSIFDNLLNKIF